MSRDRKEELVVWRWFHASVCSLSYVAAADAAAASAHIGLRQHGAMTTRIISSAYLTSPHLYNKISRYTWLPKAAAGAGILWSERIGLWRKEHGPT